MEVWGRAEIQILHWGKAGVSKAQKFPVTEAPLRPARAQAWRPEPSCLKLSDPHPDPRDGPPLPGTPPAPPSDSITPCSVPSQGPCWCSLTPGPPPASSLQSGPYLESTSPGDLTQAGTQGCRHPHACSCIIPCGPHPGECVTPNS